MSVVNMIEKRVQKVKENLDDCFSDKSNDIQQGIAFMLYCLETIFKSFDTENINYGIVDSVFRNESYDYGIDAIYVTADDVLLSTPDELDDCGSETEFVFHILQFKKGTGIGVEALLKLKEGIERAFILNDISEEQNQYMYNLLESIREIREPLYEKFRSQKIKVKIYICFTGLKSNVINNELLIEHINNIKSLLRESGYLSIEFIVLGAQELVDFERTDLDIVDIIKYRKSFKYISESEEEKLNGYICIVDAKEIGQLVSKWNTRLFEANIRDYYNKNGVNDNIVETCSSEIEGMFFWGYNNGLTITCNQVEELPNDKYKIHGLQIVNGCQTSNSIYKSLRNLERYNELSSKETLEYKEEEEILALEGKKLNEKSTLLLKIIETTNPDLIYKITETTNSQTAIKVFSLKANENIHKNLEKFFEDHKIYYERRVNFYKNKKLKPIVDIQKLAQLYLSMILIKPSQARANPKKLFLSEYDKIFPSTDVKQVNYNLYLIAVLIHLKVEKTIRNIQRNKTLSDNYKLVLLSYGKFHLDCLILHVILKKKYNEKGIIDNCETIKHVLNNEEKFTLAFNEALDNLKKIVQNCFGMKKESISTALRKPELDKRIMRFIK